MKKILFLMATVLFLGCSKEDENEPTDPVTPVVEGPEAVDDNVTTAENTDLVLSDLLENDEISEYARISEIDTESEKGGVIVDNRDGTYSYSPPENYIGEDVFHYTICDNAETPNCSTAAVIITITEASPVAMDDTFETEEEKVLVITGHLSNDQVVDNASVVSVDYSSAVGEVTIKANGDLEYSPAPGFSGTDVFTYDLCDDDENPTCSTATITMNVMDEGTPVAVKDDVAVISGSSSVIGVSELLKNDELTDDAEFTAINNTETQGTIVLNDDGTISYTPVTGFSGTDTFEYELCDDDETPICVTAVVTITVTEVVSFNIPAQLEEYYSDVVFAEYGETTKSELADNLEFHHTNHLEYTDRHDYLYDADADLTDPNYVVLMYTGDIRPENEYQQGSLSEGETFNTEHIFPQSHLATEMAKNDMHHMRVADVNINGTRSNHPFTSGSGEAKLVGGNSWYPGDDWKGDVARMVMYIHVKYGEPFSDVGTLELFLQWNSEDPVSEFELQRQEVISGAQGNRNPFIDNPYLATLIWGGTPAENRWN